MLQVPSNFNLTSGAIARRPRSASSPQDPLSQKLSEPDPRQRLSDLSELFLQARDQPELAQAVRNRGPELWSPPTDTGADMINYFERLSHHCSPPESLDWYFQTFGGNRLALQGMNIGGARVTLRKLLDKRPDLAHQAAARLLDPHPEQGFSEAQMVGLEDLITSGRWSPSAEQRACLTDRLQANLGRAPVTSGPHQKENSYLIGLLGHLKRKQPEVLEGVTLHGQPLGRALLDHLMADPERRLITIYGLEPPNQGFRSYPIYQMAFPDESLENSLLGQLEEGLGTPRSHDLLMVLTGSLEHTGGSQRLAHRLASDLQSRHEPEYVDRLLDQVVMRWLDEAPADLEQATAQRTALAQRWHAGQGRAVPLNPPVIPHKLEVSPEWIEGLASQLDTCPGEARLVLAYEATARQPELTGPLLAEVGAWLDRGAVPVWPPAAKAFRELKCEQFRQNLPEDYSTLLRQFRQFGPGIGTESWLQIASTRFEPRLKALRPLLEGLPVTVQSNVLERLADRTMAIENMTALASLEPDKRLAGMAQVLEAPIPSTFFSRLVEIAPDDLPLCLKAHHDLSRRVEAGLDPEIAFRQVTAPLVFGGRATDHPAGIGMHEGYLVVGGHRLRPREGDL